MRSKFLKFLLFVGLGALAVVRIAPALAANIVPGEDYKDLRGQLLAEGWRPETGYGQKLSNGKPFHRFPEVLCGMDRCRAKWHDSHGAEHGIMLRRGGLNDPYAVMGVE
ncbi:hypothetical protein [Rhodoblastus sp.]|uniref:hypothetical protein n=1 Tax=Rhodoblastus sp. TaxID=1962975 RepID=UPI00262F3A5F|nr:hypothetical protein [Rhodoblastus sp.]